MVHWVYSFHQSTSFNSISMASVSELTFLLGDDITLLVDSMTLKNEAEGEFQEPRQNMMTNTILMMVKMMISLTMVFSKL